MKKAVFLLVSMLVFVSLPAAESVPLPELMKPGMIAVSGERLFITENASIYIYSLKNYKLIKKFGKEGEGPQEFKVNPFGPGMVIYPFSGQLLINSSNKLSIFTQDGEFVKEIKASAFSIFTPIKDRFIGTASASGPNNKPVISVHLFNAKLEKGKELYRSDVEIGPGANFNMPINAFYTQVYKDKIYLTAGKEGFVIDVLDAGGKKLYRIRKDYEPLKITDDYKKKAMHWFKNESPFKQFVGSVFKVTFKDHFPAVKDIIVDNDQIYALTYKTQKDKNEWIIMDLKGKELKRKYLPLPPEAPYFALNTYTIYDNVYYFLAENEDEEEWELHMEKIN